MYTFSGALPPDGILPGAKFTLRPKSCLLLYWQRYCTALQDQASAKLWGVVQGMELRDFRRRRHLYSAGRPSRWASVHILVLFCFCIYVRVRNKMSARFHTTIFCVFECEKRAVCALVIRPFNDINQVVTV